MEDRMEKKRGIFSLPAKVITIAVLMISAAVFTFGIVIVLFMYSFDVSVSKAEEGITYEETRNFGMQVWTELSNVSHNAYIRQEFEIDGKYDENAVLDITDISAGVKKEASAPETSYYLRDLEQLWDEPQGTVDMLDSILENAYYLTTEKNSSLSGEIDAAETSEESAAEETETGQSSNDLLYSERFVYLYRNGKDLETVLPVSGVSLADYAAENPDTVSLQTLYEQLRTALLEWHSYMYYYRENTALQSNLQYLVVDKDSKAVYSQGFGEDVTADDFDRIAAQDNVIYVCERTEGQITDQTGISTDVQSYLSGFLQDTVLVSSNEKVVVAINEGYPYDDFLRQYKETFEALSPWFRSAVILAIAGFILFVASFVLATVQTGKRYWDGEVSLQMMDRMPLELELCITAALAGLMILLTVGTADMMLDTSAASPEKLMLLGAVAGVDAGVFIWQYLSYVRRIKGHYFWRGSLCAKLWGWLTRTCRYIVKSCRDIYDARNTSSKLILSFGGAVFVNFLLIAAFGGFGMFLAVIVDAGILLWLLRDASGRQVLKDGLKKISEGDLDFKITLDGMHGDNLEMAECINGLGNGLHAAVQKSMKSEKLKADLITNVSHDIKTPLTSIINYVDLLKREKIEDEKIKGYIDVLDSKSQRLKQLTEDLVEASKISSGNITLEFVNLNLKELIQQTNGEFSERFEAKNLELVCTLPEEPLTIRADGRRVWRIIENLYVNIAKYAMPGTRVYVSAEKRNKRVIMTFKNISEHRLNINADELTERFIRGDISRSTEGSGLGLSIAKNLAVLQKGTFDIYLDGDLFKVTVTFPEADSNEEKAEE